MHSRTWRATTLALLATLFAALASSASAQTDDLSALDGEWIYVEDRTEGRALEQLGPPMSAKFSLRSEEGSVILVRGHGSGHRDVPVRLDGSDTKIRGPRRGAFALYRGAYEDGAFRYETEFVRAPGKEPEGLIRKELRMTEDGLLVTVTLASRAKYKAVGLYLHAKDIAMPTGAKAAIEDLAWLASAWVGTRGRSGTTSIEERWSPPLGGAMLGVSRTVSRKKMTAFEYLRIVERDGGLVYIAQPGGNSPTEFVLTELTTTRAVFDNPRHDYPKRIVYERSTEGGLTATIGFMKGGSPRRFEYKREGS